MDGGKSPFCFLTQSKPGTFACMDKHWQFLGLDHRDQVPEYTRKVVKPQFSSKTPKLYKAFVLVMTFER